MTSITKLQILCFLSGLVGGASYVQGHYAITTIAGMCAVIAVVLIYSLTKNTDD